MTDSQVEAQAENNAEGVQKLTDTKAIKYTSTSNVAYSRTLNMVTPSATKYTSNMTQGLIYPTNNKTLRGLILSNLESCNIMTKIAKETGIKIAQIKIINAV